MPYKYFYITYRLPGTSPSPQKNKQKNILLLLLTDYSQYFSAGDNICLCVNVCVCVCAWWRGVGVGCVCVWGGGGVLRVRVKPVLNWANVCSPEHTSDTSTNYDSFLN